MIETYELHFQHADGRQGVAPLTCPLAEVVSRAEEVLEQSGAETLEVKRAGRHLFALVNPDKH